MALKPPQCITLFCDTAMLQADRRLDESSFLWSPVRKYNRDRLTLFMAAPASHRLRVPWPCEEHHGAWAQP
jgi:hypothetical protein